MAANATSIGARVEELASRTRLTIPSLMRRWGEAGIRPEHAAGAALAFLFLALLPVVATHVGRERDANVAEALVRTELVGRALATELRRLAGPDAPRAPHLTEAARGLPPGALRGTETLVLFDGAGRLVAALPNAVAPRDMAEFLGDGTPLTVLADRAGALAVTLPDGREVLATLRSLPQGRVALVQPLATLPGSLPAWLRPAALALVSGLVVLALAAALARQARKSRGAVAAAALVRRRIDTALARGRCGLWDWDVSRGSLSWSASMFDLLGYARRDGDLSFGEVNGLIHPADGDLYHLAERVAATPGLHLEHDFRMRTQAGGWLWLRARAEITTEIDGSRHLVGIAVDITDERGFVERHATADMRLRDAVEAVSEAFVLWDAQNRLVLCNSKFRDLHGLTGEKARPGNTYAEVMTASRPPVVEHTLTREHAEDPGARTLEAQLADGRWLQINERRTRDGGYVSVGTDITARKLHEERLLDSERRLIATVTDLRTSRETLQLQAQQLAELAESHLEQKSQAESANRAKTDFLAKMSHELRTPLNAVIGFAEVMQHQMFGPLGARYLDYAADIHGSGLYLLSVINDILQMSRIEAGLITLSPQPVSLSGVLVRAVTAVTEKASEKAIAIATDAPSELALHADERALNQVLVHILRNAVKFTPRGGEVRVRVRRARNAVNLFVEDSGIGIPRDFLARLGRPFEQAEPEFNRAQGGSGLGFAIAKAFTEMHGGGLRVRSQEGVGTVVLVHLPINPAPNPEPSDGTPLLEAA